jgi:protein-S-isoprenylcysteine O-methyltransferase Ste14
MTGRTDDQMIRLERLFVWIGGAWFVASLALTASWYARPLGRVKPFAGWRPLAYDAILFSVFALHHSALARRAIQAAVLRIVPDRMLRSVYVWTASLLLILVCLLWRPIGGDLFHAAGARAFVHAVVQLSGLSLIVLSVRAIDALELAGIRRPGPAAGGAPGGVLQSHGPYRLVRHPLYLGWMLIVFGAAHMTGDRLAFAVITSLYLVIAIPWEERSLERTFGDAYRRYKGEVRWRAIPYVF